MAIDTADKRGSVIGYMLPFPNNDIDAGDRAQTGGEYRGDNPAGFPDKISLNDLFTKSGIYYPIDNMKFTIVSETFIWDNNRLRRAATDSIYYVLSDNVLVKV